MQAVGLQHKGTENIKEDMMKKILGLMVIFALAFAALSLTGCDNDPSGGGGGGGDPNAATYTGYDGDGKEYKLEISKGANNPSTGNNPGSGNRDSRLVNGPNDAWVIDNEDGTFGPTCWIFNSNGTCYLCYDYDTPGTFIVFGDGKLQWSTSGNNILTINSVGNIILTYDPDGYICPYTVTNTTLTLTLFDSGGLPLENIFTKQTVSVIGRSAAVTASPGSPAGRAAYAPQSGDTYRFTCVTDNKYSTGTITVSNNGTTITLTPANSTGAVTVTVSENGIVSINGNGFTWDNSGTFTAPGTVTPGGSGGGGGTGGPTTWTAVTDSIFGTSSGNLNRVYSIDAIAYGNNRFVAVGNYGNIAYSSNGASWTAVSNSPFDDNIYAIAYGNNKFVALGSTSGDQVKMAYSTDGENWNTVSNTSNFGRLTLIAYGGGRFVAVGTKTAYSTDGINWSIASSDAPLGYATGAIAYGDGKFVFGDNDGNIAYSTDGTSWTVVSNTNTPFHAVDAIAYGNGRFVAGGGGTYGELAYSTTAGASWTAVSNHPFNEYGTSVSAIAYGNGRWVAVGELGGKIAYSSDGASWTAVSNHPFSVSLATFSIAYGGGRFVAASYGGVRAYADW